MGVRKHSLASRLLHSEMRVRDHMVSKFKHLMEEFDMALYDRSYGIGFVYSNLGEILKKVQAMGHFNRPDLTRHIIQKHDPVLKRDPLEQLKENINRLDEMHGRLQYMLGELGELIKKN